MANPKRGELQLSLGKQKLTARLTIDSLIRIENSIGSSIVQVAQKLSEGKATVTEIVNVLTPAIKGGGNDVDAKQIQKWVWEGEPSDIEWQRLMEIGLGILGLSPESFWNMSMIELFSAIEGFKEFNTDQSKKPLSKAYLEDLMERYPD